MVCTLNKDNSGLTSLLPITWPRIVQIDAVKNFKVPITKREVRVFLGFSTGYNRRFILITLRPLYATPGYTLIPEYCVTMKVVGYRVTL